MKKVAVIFLILIVGVVGYYLGTKQVKTKKMITPDLNSFEDCLSAGYPVLESYPRQCKSGNKTFIENVGNSLEKSDLIKLDSPRPNQKIVSPLLIQGKARGSWYFEAQFLIVLLDGSGQEIAQVPAKSLGDWMVPDFVPFTANLTFVKPKSTTGELVLRKDNPSGLSVNDDELRIPVRF